MEDRSLRTWLDAVGKSYETVLKHFPLGDAWIAFRDSTKNAGRFLKSITNLYEDAWAFLRQTADEIDYRKSEQLIVEWETALSLPDPCLPKSNTVEDRRKWVAFRLDKRRWNTIEDWYELAALFGVSVRITPGYLVQEPSLFKQVVPVPMRVLPKLGRYRIYIDITDAVFGGFPYDGKRVPNHKIPIPFGEAPGEFQAFRCFIERIKPANVLIVWNESPAIPPNGNRLTFSPEFDEEYS